MLSTALSEHQLLDALPVSIYVLDLDGNLTSVHRAASRFEDGGHPTTISSDEYRGTAIWDMLHHAMSRDHVEHAMHVLRTGRAPVVRWELDRTRDDHGVALAQMTPLHDDSHGVTGFVVSTIDVTPLHRARETAVESGNALARTIDLEHAYQEAAHQLRQALHAETVVIAVTDDDSGTPRTVYDYGSDADRRVIDQQFASVWQSTLQGNEVTESRDDSTLALSAALIGQNEPAGVITVVIGDVESPDRIADARRLLVTVAAQLAAAMERVRRVAYAARRHRSGAIGEVAAGVAHELRNPIFGISSAAQLLRFRAREDPVMEKNVGRILREVERMNRMVGTLLELGRPIALKLSPTDPDVVWDDVLESERGRLESRVIAIRRTRPQPPVSIALDGEQLAQAFKSILSNAVEAAPEATDIALQSTVLPNGTWRCRLTNGGAPIPPEMLPRVFELFLSTKPGSTGVGLALAQRIVEEHQGRITIESTAEAGTTVCVALPSTRIASLP